MSDVLETIAQQIDKIAKRPLDAALLAAGGFAFYQWLGWYGLLLMFTLIVLGWFALELLLFHIRRDTFVVYEDVRVSVPGFHPFRTRKLARDFARLSENEREKVVQEWVKQGAILTTLENGEIHE
jgi:hypothetical protein